MLLLDLPRNRAVIGFASSPMLAEPYRPHHRRRDKHRKDPRGPPAGEPMQDNQTEAHQRHRQPASGQRAPQMPVMIIAGDRFEMFLEQAVNHLSATIHSLFTLP